MAKTDLRLCVLASGSKGNSIYLEGGGARVLIDAGLTGKELTSRLLSVGVEPETLDAVIVTHDHRDHACAAGVMARRYGLPVYTGYGTVKASEAVWGRIEELREVEAGTVFSINGLEFYPFPIPHDAAEPMGLIFRAGDKKGGIATDLGFVTRLVRESLKRCNLLVVESNHEERMLMEGPYPWHLKQRVRGRMGHLSNLECAELLDDICHDGMEAVVLAHLSEVNNAPQVAYESVTGGMKSSFQPDINFSLACQNRVGKMIAV
jgi:phosphoribosyl 1,2-cyclic phosphodiesterase